MTSRTSPVRILVGFKLVEAVRDVLDGVGAYVKSQRLGWQLQCADADTFDEIFNRRDADGVITVIGARSKAQIEAVVQSGLPVVNILQDLSPAIVSIVSDDNQIGRSAAAHLLKKGFRNFAFLGLAAAWSQGRERGYRTALSEAGYECLTCNRVSAMTRFRSVSSVRTALIIRKWLAELPKPAAIMACSDTAARILLNGCAAEKIEVPKDLAILGVDNLVPTCEFAPVPLSSVAQDFPRLGFEAARQLHKLMAGKPPPHRGIVVPPGNLVERRSTDILAFDDPTVVAAMRFIHDHTDDNPTMKELLKVVPVSRRWLDERFTALVGHTVSVEIRTRRLTRICDLLLHTDLSLKQIARSCGFSSAENLNRFFNDAYRMPPNAFRVRNALPLVNRLSSNEAAERRK